MNQPCMVFGVEKSRDTVPRLDWGDGQTKNDVPTNIFSQGHKNPLDRGKKIPWKKITRGAKSHPQISHSAELGNY